MERSKFLKVLGLGAVGAVVASKIVIEATKQEIPQYWMPETQAIVDGKHITIGPGWLEQIEERGNITLYTDLKGKNAFEEALEKSFAKNPQTDYEKWWEERIQEVMDQRIQFYK